MKYRAIFFDADGVLIKKKRLFTDRLREDFGMDPEKAQPFFKGVFKECVLGRADLKEELAKVMGEWGWLRTVEELMEYWFTKGTQIDEAMAALVREVRERGIRTYLTTDQERYRGEHLRKTLRVRRSLGEGGKGNLFDEVFFSSEFGCTKDTRRYWEGVYAWVSLSGPIEKSEIFYVDDGPENVEAGKAFGLEAYYYDGDLEALRKIILQ